ncbi:Resolvase domain [Ruminiclostridium papyrosolvens DSM 2782]|uniref:Resolvase domain n=1 Tax=Ruminiclostridium papyrosolvens DSM 2782 TaxID=588581 RepID=F1TIJ5_9FIRM|nr:recombinase family protein [Ruminiclostridium papyrosolvens]EGD45812.1 Resolvase domain [Ruminiclostridium papyrosolvens DSM 2782]WES33868.1 recombinase family protein [Ruminiclostridium papyrosolvens DSM 2782]
MAQQKRAWLYCRIDAPEDKHGSLKGQEKELMDYAEQMGFEVIGVSRDIGSGLNFERNGIAEISAVATMGRIDSLLVVNISRIGRDINKTTRFITILQKMGIKIYSMAEGEITAEHNPFNVVRG